MSFSTRYIFYQTILRPHLKNTLSAASCFLPLGAVQKYQKPLQVQCKPSRKLKKTIVEQLKCRKKRTSASASRQKQGSLTAEAAFVMSLFLFMVCVLYTLFSLMEYQIEVQFALEKSVREAAIYQMEPPISEAAVRSLAVHELKEEFSNLILDKAVQVKIVEEAGDILNVELVYGAGPRFLFFGPLKRQFIQRSSRRLWNGQNYVGNVPKEGEIDAEDYVYVTQNGTVYHKRRGCTYLQLSVRQIAGQAIGDYRSTDGSKYRPCEICSKKGTSLSVVYITEDGSRYHQTRNCSGLTRWIMKVPLSQTEGRRACSRCGE